MKALLIIDMQVGSFMPKDIRFDAEGMIDRINKLSDFFRQNGDQIFYIQHDGTKNNEFIPGSVEWQILSELNIFQEDFVLSKVANDCFYKSDLDKLLTELNIHEIFITGCATDFCVDSTIRSAVTKEYGVTVVKDAHTTADRPDLSAKQVIAHHNWIWENMTPVKSEIKVVPLSSIID